MDLSTLIGIIGSFGFLAWGIIIGSPLKTFFDLPSVVVVLGCCTTSMFVSFPASSVVSAIKAAKNAFLTRVSEPQETIKVLADLSRRARREGLLSLESAADEATDDFFQRGLRLVVDGPDAAVVEEVLFGELDKIEERHKKAMDFWNMLGMLSPAMGLLGTLIGLVQMLQQMEDPSKIGPAMSVALLTTFYGAIIANVVAIPIESKLKVRSEQEIADKSLVAQGLLSILSGENPRFMVERLNATLSPDLRWEEAA